MSKSEESSQQDKTTIGLTEAGQATMDTIMEGPWFKEERDAAKLAVAVAIQSDVDPSVGVSGKTGTKWNKGSLDEDGELEQILRAFFPACQTPYRAAESLIDAGLKIISEKVKGGEGIPDLLKP